MSAVSSFARAALRVLAITLATNVVVFIGFAVVGGLVGPPPEHDVVPVNTKPLAVQVVMPSTFTDRQLAAPIAPTSSLAGLRCAAWLEANPGACPDASVLAPMFWPEATQQPERIYLGVVWPDCVASAPHFNVEFYGDVQSAIVTLHCHRTATWFGAQAHPPAGSEATAPPRIQLIIIPTHSIGAKQIWVYREDRVERWLSDSVTTTLLGELAIS